MFFANTEIRHLETFYLKSVHNVTLLIPKNGIKNLNFGGIQVYFFCSSFADSSASLYNTFLAFVGGLTLNVHLPWIGSKTPSYMDRANIKFIEAAMNFTVETR